ncbi:MAG: ATPase [Deltaproteobacteria bacterium]|nr:ATPase [Deltaproteobacteria bacterium]
MYFDYWGLKKPPFDNVPDPSMYVASHTSVENTIAETLFAIEEGNECIAVIVGDVGLGKTMSLRMVIDSLEPSKYKIAFITNPDIPFIQLLREIIGQLTGQQCEEKRKVDLLEIFNKLLFQTADEGKKVLIFIDEANAMSPANLESLRLLTNMQDDSRNLFTIVLAGQIELARRLEHPRRANLFQRIGTYCNIERIESEELVKTYVETRLALAGATKKIFTDDAISSIWVYSENGVPRLINKICKLSMKAGETNSLQEIDGNIVMQISERFQKLTGPAMPKRKPRLRSSEEANFEEPEETTIEEQETVEPQKVVQNVVIMKEQFVQPEPPPPPPVEATPFESKEEGEEVSIGKYGINVNIPPHIMEQAQSFTEEHRSKLAGVLAAQTMQKHPQLTGSVDMDPVAIWSDIRECILLKLKQEPEKAFIQG